GGGQGVVDEEIALLDVLLVDVVAGIEALDLAGDPAGVLRDVEAGDRADAALALHERAPVLRRPDPQRGHQADSGDGDAAAHWGTQDVWNRMGTVRERLWVVAGGSSSGRRRSARCTGRLP